MDSGSIDVSSILTGGTSGIIEALGRIRRGRIVD